jgi:sugar phosphate isomerase/epimerase
MEIGIFAKIFQRPDLEGTLDVVRSHGIQCVQFNMSCAGLPTLPETISHELCDQIMRATSSRRIRMPALSGTFNMIDPNVAARVEGLTRLQVLAQAAKRMAIPVITICTGTRDPNNMWRKHEDNTTKEAWADLIASMQTAIGIAQENDIVLGVEPELSNVIDSASKARRLLDELRSPNVGIVMDGSNLLSIHELDKMQMIFEQAFDLLGDDIQLVHAKDLMPGDGEGHGAAGSGVLDYDLYLRLLQRTGYAGPLILHTLRENEVDVSVAFLRTKLLQG